VLLALYSPAVVKGRNTRTECLYWSGRDDNMENEDENGSESGIGWYEERMYPQTVKSSADVRNLLSFELISAVRQLTMCPHYERTL
jgi:hypothetical protein